MIGLFDGFQSDASCRNAILAIFAGTTLTDNRHNMKKTISIISALLCVLSCTTSNSPVGELTEPLDNALWEGSEWISVADAPVIAGRTKGDRRAADGASWFVAEPCNNGKVVSAKWMTAGLGVYDLYLNGQPVGKEILKPGFTHAEKTKLSFTYDITEAYLKAAGKTNQLSVQVTPGWWADKIVTPDRTEGMMGHKCAFRGVLELVYEDGSKEVFLTDTLSWKAGIAGPVTHAAIFDGEDFDARIPQGFETPELLKTPEVNTEFAGEIIPTCGAEVYFREDKTLAAVDAYVWKEASDSSEAGFGTIVKMREYKPGEKIVLSPGENLVVDFGQNCAGVPSFEFSAKEGTVLTCLPGEMVNDGNGARDRGMDGPAGSVYRKNLRIPHLGMILRYTFAGRGVEKFTPRNTFFGYRYVAITATSKVVIKKIVSIPVSSITSELETGFITTGNELVNKLISNTYWGQLSNYLSVTTDCPQRNERLGWTADTQVYAETGSFFASTRDFFHKWMRDMRDSQGELGGFPGVAPKGQYGNNLSRVGWSDAGVIVPWTVWKQFGDTAIVDECWESMEKNMAHVAETKYDHNALKEENGNYQWADWLSYEALESHNPDAIVNKIPTPDAVEYWNYLGASYWAIDAEMMAQMARATGREEAAAKYEAMTAEAKAYLLKTFFDRNGQFRNKTLRGMQTPALFALKNNLLEGAQKEAMIEGLRQNFADHDGCLQTGFLGTSILMQTLSDNGMSDIAYGLLLQRKNPSWLYSVDNGATTIWERWNSYTLEEGMHKKSMNSFNHYAYGCVCQWIWEYAAGIRADVNCPGFKHIILAPEFSEALGSVDARYLSAAGEIRSSWTASEGKAQWQFSIPEGASATVCLAGAAEPVEYGPGSYCLEVSL